LFIQPQHSLLDFVDGELFTHRSFIFGNTRWIGRDQTSARWVDDSLFGCAHDRLNRDVEKTGSVIAWTLTKRQPFDGSDCNVGCSPNAINRLRPSYVCVGTQVA
jgi:hypothetical protein